MNLKNWFRGITGRPVKDSAKRARKFRRVVEGGGFCCGMMRNYVKDTILFNPQRVLARIGDDRLKRSPDREHRGGIIVFSTDLNSVSLSETKWVNKMKQFFMAQKNRLTSDERIDEIAAAHKLGGWTVGRFLSGRYTDPETGKLFSERSLSVSIVGVSKEELIAIAEDLCAEFDQQSVLVKSNSDGDVFFVDAVKSVMQRNYEDPLFVEE